MSLLTKKKPEGAKPPERMTDAMLDSIAATDERTRAALAERARRQEVRRLAEEEAERQKAEKAKAEKVRTFGKLAASTCAEITRENDTFTAAIVEAASALERRDAVLGRLVGLHEELRTLGGPATPFGVPAFPPDVVKAAHRVLPTLLAETGLDSPYLSTVSVMTGGARR
jgi:hypothetical protein